jgi:hypothetical protein
LISIRSHLRVSRLPERVFHHSLHKLLCNGRPQPGLRVGASDASDYPTGQVVHRSEERWGWRNRFGLRQMAADRGVCLQVGAAHLRDARRIIPLAPRSLEWLLPAQSDRRPLAASAGRTPSLARLIW